MTNESENKAFSSFKAMVDGIATAVLRIPNRKPGTTYVSRSNHAPMSGRATITRPDGQFTLNKATANPKLPSDWWDIVCPLELKKDVCERDYNDFWPILLPTPSWDGEPEFGADTSKTETAKNVFLRTYGSKWIALQKAILCWLSKLPSSRLPSKTPYSATTF
ncbi:hypothetical protein HWV62_33601 [Athelia sp. TMB]|nr:hypothetical protein HWV62_33601 [Athelia sp. TMB]